VYIYMCVCVCVCVCICVCVCVYCYCPVYGVRMDLPSELFFVLISYVGRVLSVCNIFYRS